MTIQRRGLLKVGGAALATTMLPWRAAAEDGFAPQPGPWRSFEVVTELDIETSKNETRAWVPVPSVNETAWFRSLGSTWTTNASVAELVREPKYGAQMLYLEWAPGGPAPTASVTSRIATRDRSTDFSKPAAAAPLSAADRAFYTEGTDFIPVDGIVKETSDRITEGNATDVGKARAIYEWIVDKTFRDPNTRGCGIGDIASMLKTGNLGGKCADLNGLYVGLARAAGLPARDIYGIRVAPSQFGYKSLGANTAVITKAQHCRAEVYLTDFGWVPVDPADVRKVVLEEPPGNLRLDDPKVVAARKALFGSWETNRLAYNIGHDVILPGSGGLKIAYLMYPEAMTGGQQLDSLDPANFKYAITAKEVTM
jgi:transglutaminase-like putative cysteine protease